MKALDKDRNRRYGTPGNFAEDIERYLAPRGDPGPAALDDLQAAEVRAPQPRDRADGGRRGNRPDPWHSHRDLAGRRRDPRTERCDTPARRRYRRARC